MYSIMIDACDDMIDVYDDDDDDDDVDDDRCI